MRRYWERDMKAATVGQKQIVAGEGISERKAVENWWAKHVGAPLLYNNGFS